MCTEESKRPDVSTNLPQMHKFEQNNICYAEYMSFQDHIFHIKDQEDIVPHNGSPMRSMQK